MATARIFQRPKNAMQSGRARTDRWTLEFEPAERKRPDPLTGWAGSGDTRDQIRLGFPTMEAAISGGGQFPLISGGGQFPLISGGGQFPLISRGDNFR